MKEKRNNGLLIFSVIYFLFFAVLMGIGTFYDVEIDKVLFNPESSFAQLAENFGQFVYWGMWGPALTVIFLCRRDLNGCLGTVGKVFTFVHEIKNTQGRAYKIFNTAFKLILTSGFFVLAVVGWKKLIENVIKNILLQAGKAPLSQLVYFAVSAGVAVLGIFLMRKIDEDKLRKLEALALAGVLLGIFFKVLEECKTITERVRFREMVAYSNGFLNDKGMSEGKYSALTGNMAQASDFSAFTRWYQKGSSNGIYSRCDSFPSGHTAYSCTVFLSYMLCKAFDGLKKLSPLALAISFAYVCAMCISRMIAGAHYLTDVAAAAAFGYGLFLIVYTVYGKLTKKGVIG